MNRTHATLIASAVAALLTSACGSDDSKDDVSGQSDELVRCEGINECKGMSECAGATNGCEGMNECKGMGFLTVPESECDEKGGKNLDADDAG